MDEIEIIVDDLTEEVTLNLVSGDGISDHTLLSNIGVKTHATLDSEVTANTLKVTYPGDQDLSGLALKSNVLELDNTDVFAPTLDYHPSTKKYVDDNAGGGGGGKFVDGTDPLDAVYLDGNVGIGKQPTALFDSDEVKTQKIIAGGVGANGFGIWNNANTRQDIFLYEDHNALWSTLGIGEVSPSQNERLWLGGSVNFGRISMAMQNSHARGFGSIFVRNDLSNEISLGIVGSNQSILGITEVSHITVKNNTPLVLATNNTVRVFVKGTGEVHINGTDPQAQLDVNGGIKIADDTDTITVDKIGTMRYRSDANNSYMDMAMQTGVATYQWVNIKTNTW